MNYANKNALQATKEFHKYVDETIDEINELDLFTSFNLHTDESDKSTFYVSGFKGDSRKRYSIPLNKYRNRDDNFNVKLFPLFKEANYGEEGGFTEIMTGADFKQENVTYNKYTTHKRNFYKNGSLAFKTAFMTTKPAHLMFQTNIFKKDIDIFNIDHNIMDMCFFDIETSAGRLDETGEKVGNPFDNMPKQKNKIRAITTYSTKRDKFFVFTYKNFDVANISKMVTDNVYYDDKVKQDVKDRFDSLGSKIEKVYVKDEATLLKKFIAHLRDGYDALVGWNSSFFDLPFIVSRIRTVLGPQWVNKLSPFDSVELRPVYRKNKDGSTSRPPRRDYDDPDYDPDEGVDSWYVEIAGIVHVDLQKMYENFNFEPRMSYSLSNIMICEAGIDKIEKPTDDFDDFYKDDFDTYILYNIQDVNGLREVDLATDYIKMALLQAAESKINIVDTYSKTTLHTFAMIDKMRKEKKVYANDKSYRDEFSYEGGRVVANMGVYHLLKSRDFKSLYPTNIINFNMSIETIFHAKDYDKMVAKIGKENIITTLDPDIFFRKDITGLMADYALNDFNKRSMYKKLMKTVEYGSLEYIKYDSCQYNQKIKINSLYGANGAPHWYFSNMHIADIITRTGRYLITEMEKVLTETNKNVELLTKHYNQNIYELAYNNQTMKVYGDSIVKVNRNNDVIDIMVDDMNENDMLLAA